MARRTRVGIFGGTFDPPHLGHIAAAREVAEAVDLERVLWVPASIPPHKRSRSLTQAAVRRRMVEAAVACDPRFELCDLELERGGVSYTVDTLRSLGTVHPEWRLVLIVGADLVAGMSRWKEPDAVAELAELVVMSRGGEVPGPDCRGRVVAVSRVEVSSSRVRGRVRERKAVRDMVGTHIMSIIESEGLYRQPRRPRVGAHGQRIQEGRVSSVEDDPGQAE